MTWNPDNETAFEGQCAQLEYEANERARAPRVAVTVIRLGRVTLEVDRVERHCGHDHVFYWMSTSGIRNDEHIENGGQPVMCTREAWEEMAKELCIAERVRRVKAEGQL